MANDCELVVVRHGLTLANNSGTLQGQLDSPLDETGLLQAEALAERLKAEAFDACYASDLGRAVQTAEAILRFHPDLPLIRLPALREWHLGELEGKTFDVLYRDYADLMIGFLRETPEILVPGGESKTAFSRRIGDLMDSLAAKHPGQRLLLVSHGGAIQAMFRKTVGNVLPDNLLPLSGNASLNVFRRRESGWQLTVWNDCSHLRGVRQKELFTY